MAFAIALVSSNVLAMAPPVQSEQIEVRKAADVLEFFPCDTDLNNDGVVNLTDVVIFSDFYNRYFFLGEYEPRADFNNDGKINLTDLIIFAPHVGTIVDTGPCTP